MSRGVFNIEIRQGASFKMELEYRDKYEQPIDLTGCTFAMEIRDTWGGQLIADFTPHITSPSPAEGVININVPPEETDVLDFDRARHDLLVIYSDDTVERIIEGNACLNRKVTEISYV